LRVIKGITKYDNNKIKITNTKIYIENPKWEKPWLAISKESTVVLGEYIIYLKVMCRRKRSISEHKFTQNALLQNKNSRTNG